MNKDTSQNVTNNLDMQTDGSHSSNNDSSEQNSSSSSTEPIVVKSENPVQVKTEPDNASINTASYHSFTIPEPTSCTSFEEIQNQLKATLDHVEQRNMVSGFQTLSKATSAVVDHCEQLGTFRQERKSRYQTCLCLQLSLKV